MREQTKRTEIYKRALFLAVPMMIQNGITNMVGLVDNVMVGKLGTESMTAVSIVGQLIFVFNLAIFGGISGPGIYGAQYYGQRNEEGFRHTLSYQALDMSRMCYYRNAYFYDKWRNLDQYVSTW